jgi:putative ABC transport system substrate-binding protein
MRRRAFIAALGSASAAWPLAAIAQQPEKGRAVAFVLPTLPEAQMSGAVPAEPVVRAFIEGLRDHGWVDGRNVSIIRRTAEGQRARAQAIFDELVARRVDVIALGVEPWLHQVALRATSTIPIAAVFSYDPVAVGVVASLARPGGNLTGVNASPGIGVSLKRLQLLRELAPSVDRIAFLGPRGLWDYFGATADTPVQSVFFVQLDRTDQQAQAFATILRERANAIMVLGAAGYILTPQIVAFAAENRLPTMFGWRSAVEKGGLISFGPSNVGYFRQLAGYVHRILKGAQASSLPIEQPTTFEMVINLKTATALGLTVPQSIQVQADQVIE